MKNLFISINRRRNFLMQPSLLNHLYTPQLYFPYLIKYIYSHRYRDSKRKIHLREWNRNFPTFPNSIVPLETKSIWFITQPTTTQTLRNCIGVARTKSNSPQSARSGVSIVCYNEYHFSGCCIRSVNIFCQRARDRPI